MTRAGQRGRKNFATRKMQLVNMLRAFQGILDFLQLPLWLPSVPATNSNLCWLAEARVSPKALQREHSSNSNR